MPIKIIKDSKGCCVQWGSSGKKYYYKCGDKEALERAKEKAEQQAKAIYASRYKEK